MPLLPTVYWLLVVPRFSSNRRQWKERPYVSPVAQAVGRQARLTRMETASLSSAPSSSSAPALSGLHVGAKVRHDRFGEGEVTAIEGEGGNAKATVSFAHFGQKQLLLKFARLTIVE